MKYFALLLVVVFLSLSIISALDIGYVVRNPGSLDSDETAVKSFLIGEGHSVVILDDVSFDESVYDIVVVSDSVNDIGNIFDHTNTRTLFMSNSAAKKKGLGSSSGTSSDRFATIEKSEQVTDGYSLGSLQVYSTQSTVDYLLSCFPINSKNLVSKSSSTRSLVLTLDTDALLIDNSCTDRDKQIFKKNLYFGLVAASNWNSNAKDLFRNSIAWLVEAQDLDGDGYSGILDCDDGNSNVNPGATEIAYNGIDEDCSGSDLRDVDGDGYDAIIVGGDDCNDNDATVNPGSSDETKDCVNDGPTIDSFSPENPIDLLENVDNTFSVTYSDNDNLNDVTVTWKVDGQIVSTGDNYVLNTAQGDYTVVAVVSDGSNEVEQTWTVYIKDSSFFSCSSFGGDICTTSETCNGTTLSVNDSNSCCSVTCVAKDPEFADANVCDVLEKDIEIDFLNIDYDEEFEVTENIDFTVRIRNEYSKDQNFDITAYLYDLTDDNVEDRIKEKVKIKDDDRKLIGFEFEKDVDLNEGHTYALLIVVEDDVCNQAYEQIDITRAEHDIIVDKVEFSSDNLVCGDALNVDVEVNNLGRSDEDVYIILKNSKLKINERTEGFELEEYGEDDAKTEKFSVVLPDNVKSGEYSIRAEVYYENRRTFYDKVLTLGECPGEVKEVSEIISLGSIDDPDRISVEENLEDVDSISLGSSIENLVDNQEGDLETEGGSSFFRNVFLVFLIVFGGVAGFVVYNFSLN